MALPKSAAPAPTPAPRPPASRRPAGFPLIPHVTEKSSAGRGQGWYTFRVPPGTSKIAIRRAVEDGYGVFVERVRVSNRPAKAVRIGRTRGQTPGFKKAMVKVRAGQSIELT